MATVGLKWNDLQKARLQTGRKHRPCDLQANFKAFKRRDKQANTPAKVIEVFKIGTAASGPEMTAFLK